MIHAAARSGDRAARRARRVGCTSGRSPTRAASWTTSSSAAGILLGALPPVHDLPPASHFAPRGNSAPRKDAPRAGAVAESRRFRMAHALQMDGTGLFKETSIMKTTVRAIAVAAILALPSFAFAAGDAAPAPAGDKPAAE